MRKGAILGSVTPAAVPVAAATAAAPARKPAEMQQLALRTEAAISHAGQPQDQAAGTAAASAEAARAQSNGAGAWELASVLGTGCQNRQGRAALAAAQAPSDAMPCGGKPTRPSKCQISDT